MMRFFALMMLPIVWIGCGVKGDPEPPDTPPRLGHGQPTFERATQDLALPDLTPVHPKDDAEKEE